MSVRVFVPRDTTALSLGADAVARRLEREAQQRGLELTVVRTS